jgi:tetratricopeptide (TPR) repeat protein
MSYWYLGDLKTAAEQFQLARALYSQHAGPTDPGTLATMSNLAGCYNELNRNTEALQLIEEALPLQKAKLGPEHPDTLRSIATLASIYASLSRHAEALQLREQTLQVRQATLGPDHPSTIASMSAVASSYDRLDRRADALKLTEEILALRKAKLGPDHPDTLKSMSHLAACYWLMNRDAEAVTLNEKTLQLLKAKLGPDHRATLHCMHILANSYNVVGRYDDANKLREEVLALRIAKLGPDHPDTLSTMNNLAWVLATANDVKSLPRALELAKKAAQSAPKNAGIWGTLGTVRYRSGDWRGAIADLEKAIGLRTSEYRLNAHEGFFLAMAYWQLGDKDKAHHWFAKSVQWMDQWRIENSELKGFRDEAAELMGQALKVREEAIAHHQAKFGPEHPRTLTTMNDLAWFLATAADIKLRDPRRALELASKTALLAPKDAEKLGTYGTALYRTGNWPGAIAELEKAIGLRNSEDPNNASDGFFLAMAYWQHGDKDKARTWFTKSAQWMHKGGPELKRFHAEAAALLGLDKKE